ncbi:restriction system modified-DNA reader domain-containing protein [Actinomyces oris]
MAMYELDGNHLLPVRLGRSADAITLSHSLVAIQRQIVDVLRRPLFPLSWEELETGASLTALDATGQVVVVEVLERVDSTGLLAAMSRLTQAATAGRREIASRYAGGLGAFSQDWNEFREAMPAQVEAGPRLTILSASLEPDVVGGLGVLASSGLEIHEVDVRIVDESRIVVVVEKISGMDVAAGGPLLVARAPRPALAGSASSGSNGSRGMDATEQAEHMSPVTGPIEIVMPSEPVTAPEAGGVDDASAAIPAGAFAATGAADALSELFEPVAVTAEQPQVHALSDQGGDEAPPEDPEGAGGAQPAGQAVPEPDEGAADVADAPDGPVDDGTSDGAADDGPATDAEHEAEHSAEVEHSAEAEPEAPQSRPEPGPESSDGAPQAPAAGSVGQDLADILSGDTVTVPAVVDLGEEPVADDAGHGGRSDSTDDSSAEERAVAALAGGVDILGGSSLSGGSGSAASAGEAPSPAGSRTRMGRRSRAAHSQPDASSAAPAAQAWSTVAPNESRTEAPTGAVPLVSWEPLRGSADALDPVAEALGGDPSKSLQVQETAELAAVAASLGKPTQLIWQRLRRGIYHEAILSVEGVITLSDGRSFTDPTSAANAAQAVTDADGWRVWRVGVHGAHLGDLRDDLADRSL